uniref:Chaperonin GroEL n=1 Tax=uncultured virus TaxID=340016 RepID=A0A240F7A6_9VIRU|nr:chaperonin GroEL [uncultured virus]
MEYNLPSEFVKELNFGDNAKNRIVAGVNKLASAVKSTLGASGKCVIYEDARGKPVITKDGVTVAQSVTLLDPVENIGATLIKEAASKTVKEAGDGTTTATVLAESLLQEVYKTLETNNVREVKQGIDIAVANVIEYLDSIKIEVSDDMLDHVASISCNNDKELGKIIAEAYKTVGKEGVVLMEASDTDETYVETVDGVQFDSGLISTNFVTNTDKQCCDLENPLILMCMSEIPNIRKIQKVLEHVIKNNRSLLIIAPVADQVKSALMMNKVKGNIKVNIIDLPGFGPTKKDTCEDVAILTNCTLFNEDLGDDLDTITPEHLGEAEFIKTDEKNTVITLEEITSDIEERIDHVAKLVADEKNGFMKKKLEDRLAILSGSVAIVKVGANSKVELKEKRDRVEDAVYAVKAALKEGIVPGGGIALFNASQKISTDSVGEQAVANAIISPMATILDNAGISTSIDLPTKQGEGINVVTGKTVNMVAEGIIDPVLVTKTALINAASVASTIISADCVISNIRANEGS